MGPCAVFTRPSAAGFFTNHRLLQEESHWAVGDIDTHCVPRPSQFLSSEREVSLSGGSGAFGNRLVSGVTNGSLR